MSCVVLEQQEPFNSIDHWRWFWRMVISSYVSSPCSYCYCIELVSRCREVVGDLKIELEKFLRKLNFENFSKIYFQNQILNPFSKLLKILFSNIFTNHFKNIFLKAQFIFTKIFKIPFSNTVTKLFPMPFSKLSKIPFSELLKTSLQNPIFNIIFFSKIHSQNSVHSQKRPRFRPSKPSSLNLDLQPFNVI